jgi:hypothetical protein
MGIRATTVLALIVIVVCGCGRRDDPSFDQERYKIERAMPNDAQLVSKGDTKRTGYTTEASWDYELAGPVWLVQQRFEEQVPADYKLVRRTGSDSAYARFDGHDEFDLTFAFRGTQGNPTTITVVLKSMPD